MHKYIWDCNNKINPYLINFRKIKFKFNSHVALFILQEALYNSHSKKNLSNKSAHLFMAGNHALI